MFTEPRKMPKVILADARSGLDLDTREITVSILDNEIDFPFVNVAILTEGIVG